MSSKSGKYLEISDNEIHSEEHFEFKNIVIQFSRFFNHTPFIYTGEEKIPFKDRFPEYKQILLHEFGELRK
ncbi:MAG: hypothetical protein ACW986_03780 [Promethearchaeota archaeon]|jgi:hypothetical protein